jgi:hypothetical protein
MAMQHTHVAVQPACIMLQNLQIPRQTLTSIMLMLMQSPKTPIDMAGNSRTRPTFQLQACSSCRYAAIAKQQLPHRQLKAIPQRWYLSAGCAKNPKKLHSQNPMLPAVFATCIHHSLRQG